MSLKSGNRPHRPRFGFGMKAPRTVEENEGTDRDLFPDVVVALLVTAAFALFAMTVLQMDSMAQAMILFSGRTVYM